jgi:hypothetical protein
LEVQEHFCTQLYGIFGFWAFVSSRVRPDGSVGVK